MPAEIDTGGPRVLHCDYRADCPIPILASTSIDTFPRRENGSSLPLPRPDENESLDHGAPKSRRRAGFSSRRAARSGFRGSCRTETRDAALIDVPVHRLRDRVAGPEDSGSPGNASRPRQPESRLLASPEGRETERELARRIPPFDSTSRDEESDGEAAGWHRYPATRCSGRCDSARRGARTGRSTTAWFSSRSSEAPRSDRSADPEKLVPEASAAPSLADDTRKEVDATNSWRGESRVAKVAPRDFPSSLDRDESSRSSSRRRRETARKRRTKKKRRECPGDRSVYVHLALLLFLVAFGQCGLRRFSALGCRARPGTTGLSVFAIGTVIGAVSAAPLDLAADAGVRAERSANLSHITGASRKIQMYIKNRHLQILPDGTVNGSNDDTSDYTIFQRTSVSRGQLRIQGVATCLYLCMDSCGLLYGSREYTDDCVFNETLEQHNYNTYSSAKWSTARKTLYLGLNRRGQPRRVQAKGHNLGRLSAYARVLTQVASLERVEALQRRMLGAQHNVRHRHNSHRGDLIQQSVCPTLPVQEKDGRDKFRCRKRKKRKKRKRKCRAGEKPGPQCRIAEEETVAESFGEEEDPAASGASSSGTKDRRWSCEMGGAANAAACRRQPTTLPSKKRKHRPEETTSDGAATADVGNVSNGKSKAPSAKKLAGGGVSESKKPNLPDGKRRKKKGPAARRKPAAGPPEARKRFALGRHSAAGNGTTSAPPVPASASTSATSSSSWRSPGAPIVPSGRGASPSGRGPKPARKRARPGPGFAGGARRVGKAFGRNRTASAASARKRNSAPAMSVLVPDSTALDGSFRESARPAANLSLTSSRLDTESIDEDSLASSAEHATTTIDPTTLAGSASDAELASTTARFGSSEDENGSSVETVDDDSENESDGFVVTPQADRSISSRIIAHDAPHV